MRTRRMCLPLLVFCTVLLHTTAHNWSRTVLNFVAVISGSRNNKAQIEARSEEFDLVEVTFRQVDIPVLRDETVLFMETAINGAVAVLNLMLVTQDSKDSNIVYATPYNFTDTSKYKPGQFNVDDLQNLTLNDLHREADCVDSYVRLKDGVFSGINFLCPIKINGRHPGHAVTMTCGECSSVFPYSLPVLRAASVPYLFQLVAPRYPLLNAPDDYVGPCSKTNN